MQLSQVRLSQRNAFNQSASSSGTRLSYRVGALTFGLIAEGDLHLVLDRSLSDFASESEFWDVNVRTRWVDSLEIPRSSPLFQSGGLWSLFSERNGYSFSFLAPLLGTTPYKGARKLKE